MKVRIRGNSVRVRLVRGEVERLARGGAVNDVTHFGPDSALKSRVEIGGDAIAVTFLNGTICVRIPKGIARDWSQSERVSLQAEQDAGGGHKLTILIEKDFECLHSEAEKVQDAYPNPRGSGVSR